MKKTIAVIFGGCSDEYEVSLKSAYNVLINLDEKKYNVIPIGITKRGRWFRYTGCYENIPNGSWCVSDALCVPVIASPDREEGGIVEISDGCIKRIDIDAVFPVMHGLNGEDGTVQAVFELAGIPVIGCGMLSSAVCMDKNMAHEIVRVQNIDVPESRIPYGDEDETEVLNISKELGYPQYIKPVRGGSSIGITKVDSPDGVLEATRIAFLHDSKVLIEKNVEGFEVGCAVMGENDAIVGLVDEIELSEGVLDYDEKYNPKNSVIHVPARVDKSTAEKIADTAKTIYRALCCKGFARVDMFLTPDKRIVFNEVNTIPGLTEHSRFPNMMKGIGLAFRDVLDSLIESSL